MPSLCGQWLVKQKCHLGFYKSSRAKEITQKTLELNNGAERMPHKKNYRDRTREIYFAVYLKSSTCALTTFKHHPVCESVRGQNDDSETKQTELTLLLTLVSTRWHHAQRNRPQSLSLCGEFRSVTQQHMLCLKLEHELNWKSLHFWTCNNICNKLLLIFLLVYFFFWHLICLRSSTWGRAS